MKRCGLILWTCLLAVTVNSVWSEDPLSLGVRGGAVSFSVQMDLRGMDIEFLLWRFNSSYSVLRFSNESKNPLKTYPDYEGRVGLDPQTYTLTLHGLHLNDSGVYSARIIDHKGNDKDVAKHILHVHEAVPELLFSMSLLYFNSSEGFCNVSVVCEAGSSMVSATCDLENCVQVDTSLTLQHLQMGVSLGRDTHTHTHTIYCNASNLVSHRSQWGHMETVCMEEVDPILDPISGLLLVVLDTAAPLFLILLLLLLFCLIKRRRHTGYYDRFTTKAHLKRSFASIELLNIYEFEEFHWSPFPEEVLKGNPADADRKLPLLPQTTEPYSVDQL
ncbi:SLAM family member 9-like [Sardina pilchardus]|uniref:SLAM family member 9-like n=1 Tax=Sardina pilchardus TaxID=27697 RepID=UPI002E158C95